jgi:hypothetical protein
MRNLLALAGLGLLLGGPAAAGAPGTSSSGVSGIPDVPRPGIFSQKSVDETSGRGQPTDCGSLTSQSLTASCAAGGPSGQLGAPLPSNRNAGDSIVLRGTVRPSPIPGPASSPTPWGGSSP